ncbi:MULTISPECIES: TRAP transporter small permease subunit [Rhodobacterales]|uniref:TRAP transporter small permease protein n=1 Tax=Tritonibacter horizontis TaxID=1768241 RepID=A0A132C0Q1_9RHOB|nr:MULTISPECIES: TRAP transporter small permease subunit [Rhodobacterales]KHA54155.1 TRAP dicarboxylate transporter, DctQ subunit [Sulfitobacter geojensis]KUP94161.1 tripartite ATP-independent periplasmic transporter, DctQ component [Tritonibacter horizontis]NYI29977.1 TRAP-type C4-dicarboxylate transport system permease small subunit [Sulfitobacter geojensis]
METAFRRFTQTLMYIGGAGLLFMMLHVTLDVVLKVAFNAPIQGTVEISSYYYMVGIVMLPMALVELEDDQISVDLLFNLFPAPLQKVCLLLTLMATAAVLAVIAWRTGQDAIRAFRVGEVVMGSREIIVWPARCMLPLGFTLAAIAALLRVIMVIQGKTVTRNTTDEAAG